MKRSELKELVRLVCEEYITNQQSIREEHKSDAHLFDYVFNYVKKHDDHSRTRKPPPIEGSGWESDNWELGNIVASTHQHFDEIKMPELLISKNHNGEVEYHKGSREELSYLLHLFYNHEFYK